MDSPSADWSLSTSDRDQAYGQWERMLSDGHLPWSVSELHPVDGTFAASVRKRFLADLILVDCACDPNTGRRSAYEIGKSDEEYLVLLMTLGGHETVTQSGSESQLRSGSLVVWDSEKPALFEVQEALQKRSLFVPKRALAEVGSRGKLSKGVVLDASSPAVVLLTGYLATLSATIDQLPLAAIPAARNATIELMAAALHPDSILGGASQETTRTLAERHIEQNLRDINLSPAAIAVALGVSVRSLHRSFDSSGETVSSMIRIKRLARAKDEIGRGEAISRVAYRWAFSDASHFSRAFKAHYEVSPSDYRSAVMPLAGS